MNKITLQEVIDSVPTRWSDQYHHYADGSHHRQVLEQLQALNPPLSKVAVDTIIGNTSWTELTCDECGKDTKSVVQVGQAPDYESLTARLCLPCLRAAVKLARQSP